MMRAWMALAAVALGAIGVHGRPGAPAPELSSEKSEKSPPCMSNALSAAPLSIGAPEGPSSSLPPGGPGRSEAAQLRRDSAQVDAEWLACGRTVGDQVRRLAERPESAAPTALFRSHTFNPRDVFLSPADRSAIRAVVEDSAPAIEAAAGEHRAAMDRGLTSAVAAGRATRLSVATLRRSRWSGPLGRDPFLGSVDGETFAVAATSLPAAVRTREQLRVLGADLATRLIAEFGRAGALDAGEQAALRKTLLRSRRSGSAGSDR